MDSRKPPNDPDHLLDDLESIHDLLGEQEGEPPLLTESFEPDNIPLLSDVVKASPRPARDEEDDDLRAPGREQARLDSELRAAAQLILQDVIDDFVPQIEAELQRRLEARLQRLLAQRKP
ncbi:DNA polymerase III subunit chi [Pseudomonas citronellolis]|uniref:DNA polymerase III subunit chi n=1 Tax=Pseudomonas citronellolis TaxID=53408 RepID=UPI0023E3F2A6|nr:DNA polymerase III subunit chi [Pseudomonas citronellolis]MDF3935043.1 DNA polymerase III subunit chi [Pseudomonas citronellolis]